MSSLSELLPSGGGQNVVSLTANGAITAGAPVAIQNSGTIRTIAADGALTAQSVTFADKEVFESAASYGVRAAYGNGAFVILYTDQGNSNYWTAVAGTVDSSGNITLGSPLVLHSVTGHYSQGDIIYHPTSEKFVAVWGRQAGSNYGKVLTVSGTSLSAGSPADIETSDTTGAYSIQLDYDSNIDRVIALLNCNGTMKPAILEISGTSINKTAASTFSMGFSSSAAAYVTSCFDSDTNKVIVAYRISTTNLRVNVLTCSTSDISVGSATDISVGSSGYLNLTYNTSQSKALLTFLDFSNSRTDGVVLSVSGTTTTAGSVTTLTTDNMELSDALYNSDSSVTVLTGRNDDPEGGQIYTMSISISGTTPVNDNFEAVHATDVRETGIAYDSDNGYIIAGFRDDGNSDYGTAITFKPHGSVVGSNVSDTIGIAAGAIANSAAGNINVFGGISTAHSGLTIGSDYYVQSNGAITTTSDSPAVLLGQAISATTINMRNLT